MPGVDHPHGSASHKLACAQLCPSNALGCCAVLVTCVDNEFHCRDAASSKCRDLPYSMLQRFGIPAIVATVQGVAFAVLASTVAFPFPFIFQVFTQIAVPFLLLLHWFAWRDALHIDHEAKQNLLRFAPAFVAQVTAFVFYSVFNIAFISASQEAQPFVSMCLPIMKFFLKNLMKKGVLHIEDLAPS